MTARAYLNTQKYELFFSLGFKGQSGDKMLANRSGGGCTWKILMKKVGLILMIGARLPEVDLGKDTRKSTLSFSSEK